MLSNVRMLYRKVTQGTIRNFCDFISVGFFECVLAALLVLEMAAIAPV